MRKIDWIAICEESGIEYRSRGANVASGNINVHCPFCGPQDPSYHLGISLNGKGWGCWRNATHRGKSAAFLVRRILGPAASVVIKRHRLEEGSAATASRGRLARAKSDEDELTPSRPEVLEPVPGVVPFDPANPKHEPFSRYLTETRGFRKSDLGRLATEFGLQVGYFGEYNSRIVIPYIVRGRPVFFTARAIRDAELRYKAMPFDRACIDPKTICFNHDAIESPGGIILCEGQLDALKCSLYGPLPAVGLNTNHATPEQIKALSRASRVFMILDNDKGEDRIPGTHSEQTLLLYHDLIRAGVPCRPVPMPPKYKDLCEIPWRRFSTLITLDYLLCASH